jgi:hypothetical protein
MPPYENPQKGVLAGLRPADVAGVLAEIRLREELMKDLRQAVQPGEPLRLLVTFRLSHMADFAYRFGDRAREALLGHIADCLPRTAGPASFYYRIRKDELCGLIGGQLSGIEGGLSAAAREVDEMLGSSGISLGFGTAILPYEAGDPTAALALVDSRIMGVKHGERMPREESVQMAGQSKVYRPTG